jgi:anti-sigma regulatory factor (Ser/Thr protein kinase)
MTPPEVRASFPAEPASASAARRFIDRTLRHWSCDHLTDVASLLLSELVANAVLHAGTTIDVTARVMGGGRLRIEVGDGNARIPARKHYSRMSATGRGLLMVERMATDWGVTSTPSGKVVWFELDENATEPSPGAEVPGFDDFDFDLGDLAPVERRPQRHDRPGGGPGETPRLLAGAGRRR